MMCAAVAGQRGASVALIDHAKRIGEKIRISGGGRCNFTNLGTGYRAMIGENPRFARFALHEYTPQAFVELVRRYGIDFHEKHRGQLFCDHSAQQIIDLLVAECELGQVQWFNPVQVDAIAYDPSAGYCLRGAGIEIVAKKLVIATGGLSIPKIGATDFGYKIARQFGLRTTDTRPSLVPLTVANWDAWAELAGVSLPVRVRCASPKALIGSDTGQFDEDLLFTHRGLSGPAILQISNYWTPGTALQIDFSVGTDFTTTLIQQKSGNTKALSTVLSTLLPKQLSQRWLNRLGKEQPGLNDLGDKRIADLSDKVLRQLGDSLNRWVITPDGTEGFKKAEVTRGGVATDELDPRTMEAKRQPGLHFIGEVVDITGWLGGYNFQWAWSSAYVCGHGLTR